MTKRVLQLTNLEILKKLKGTIGLKDREKGTHQQESRKMDENKRIEVVRPNLHIIKTDRS